MDPMLHGIIGTVEFIGIVVSFLVVLVGVMIYIASRVEGDLDS